MKTAAKHPPRPVRERARPPLNPSVWRTCRVLANRSRLKILRWLFQNGETHVTAVARQFRITEGGASFALRLLQSRGLLAVRRVGRFVYYRPSADPSIPWTRPLLSSLRRLLSTPNGIEAAFSVLTAFTHPRRIQILHLLIQGPALPAEIRRASSISRPAFKRHMAKLRRRGLILLSPNAIIQLAPSDNPLTETLLATLRSPGSFLDPAKTGQLY